MRNRLQAAALAAFAAVTAPAWAQDDSVTIIPNMVGAIDKDPTLTCSRISTAPLNHYGLARALLTSLSYGKDASDQANEIKTAASQASDMTGLMTELLRISKTSSNLYRCAEQPLVPFNQPSTDKNLRMVAQSALLSWHQNIEIDERLQAFAKRMGSLASADMADQMSTMQVDRDNAWASLMPILQVTLLSLEDVNRLNAAGKVDRLLIDRPPASGPV